MAQQRLAVPEATKRALRAHAGGTCANPGCPARRTELHHIREWAVYQSHDGEHMIAVCPTCHDAIHHGPLKIDDETLYRWKLIRRDGTAERGHLYVEPAVDVKLLLGSVAVTADRGLIVFAPSAGNRLSFALEEAEVVLLSLAITDRRGREVLRMVDGYVRVEPETGVEYLHAPGRLKVTAPLHGRYLPRWAADRVRANEPDYEIGDRAKLLDVEVLEPGLVRIAGIWLEAEHGAVITERMLHFVEMTPERPRSLALRGDGPESVLRYTGPLDAALFQFVRTSNAREPGAVRLGDSPTLQASDADPVEP